MAKVLTCADMGLDCGWTGTADTIEELLRAAADHGAEGHGVKDIPNEMVASMRRAIKET